jgi:hypothetical protein
VEICDDDVAQLDRKLSSLQRAYRLKKRKWCLGATGASSKLQTLESTLKEWLNDEECHWELTLLRNRHNIEVITVLGLADAISETVRLIKSQRKPRRPESPATALFVDLYCVYTSETGKTGLSDCGPAIRFVTECAKLTDPNIIIPTGLRQVINVGLKRRDAFELPK